MIKSEAKEPYESPEVNDHGQLTHITAQLSGVDTSTAPPPPETTL